jgi:hypothetical protein
LPLKPQNQEIHEVSSPSDPLTSDSSSLSVSESSAKTSLINSEKNLHYRSDCWYGWQKWNWQHGISIWQSKELVKSSQVSKLFCLTMNQNMNDIHCQSKSIPLVSKKWNMKTWLRCIYISQNPLFQTLIFQGDRTILYCHPCCQTLEKFVSIRAVVGREAMKRAHFSVNPNTQRLNPFFLQTRN